MIKTDLSGFVDTMPVHNIAVFPVFSFILEKWVWKY